MTRDEAEKIAGDAWRAERTTMPETFVEILCALGLLKLDEPKTAWGKFCEEANAQGYSQGVLTSNVRRILCEANLKIVEADK